MAESSKEAPNAPEGQVVPAPAAANRDRVVGVSLRSDGTIAENNPELIGDKEAVLAATQEQFRQFAVSAIDQDKRRELGLAPTVDEDTSDALIDALREEHKKAEAAADKAAEALVNKLHKG